MSKVNVGIIGAGNMGEAIINGLKDKNNFSIYAYDKNVIRINKMREKYPIKTIKLEKLTNICKIIIICVKPQDMDSLILRIKGQINNKHLLISIAAGVTTIHIEKSLGAKVAVIRVMPNLPGLIGQGVSAYCLGKNASNRDAKDAETIFKTMGKVLETKENKMNAITAISGSGPGFIAYFINALQEAALDAGFNKKDAGFLAVNAAAGTVNMIVQEEIDPAEFAKRVTSKGGTTEAGINEFKKANLKSIVKSAAKAATKRAKELSK